MELSLEENRAQRGSAGYVDMVRVFKLYPETARAKESFADAVRQAEEGVNIRKAEILHLRGEVSSLKAERGVLAAAAEAATLKAPPAPVTVSSAPAAIPAAAIAPASTAAVQLPGLPGISVPEHCRGPEIRSAGLARGSPRGHRCPAEKKTGELTRKELEPVASNCREKNLLDLGSRKTEILLGKIHRVIMDVARREGISVRWTRTISYGHEAGPRRR